MGFDLDKSRVERWQSEELIPGKLWCITRWGNLDDLQSEFPEVNGAAILQRLVEDPRSTKAAISLFGFIKDPDNEDNKPLVDPLKDKPSQYNYCSGLL